VFDARSLSYLHGDADVEVPQELIEPHHAWPHHLRAHEPCSRSYYLWQVASEGWDDTSAYGYNHVLDDPSMGHTRSCHGLRIAGHDAWLSYAAPTREAVVLMARVADRLRADGRERSSAAFAATPAAAASLHLSEELFLPVSLF
jgi:hypothetical protein